MYLTLFEKRSFGHVEEGKVWILSISSLMGLFLLLIQPSVAAVLTDGPLIGGVTDNSAKVFVRTDSSASVVIELSKDASLASSILTPPVWTLAEVDFTTIVKLTDLQPQTTYYYRILVDGIPQQNAPFPSFTSFPSPGATKDFSFAVVSDLVSVNKFPADPAPVYAQVMAETPAFVLQIGDFDHRDPKTLEAMRQMHREVRGPYTASGLDFFRYIAPRFPVFHVWDDHDYGANNGDKTFPGRLAALKAFQEYYPTPDLANPVAGIWHKFTYGQAEFFMLDLRSQRDPNFIPDGPRKSMLDGNRIPNGQKAWLKISLLTSTARWKFLISSVPFNPTSKPKDGWGAFVTEWAEIVNFIRQFGIQGVIVISGDLHSGGGIDDGTSAGFPEITVPHTNLRGGDSGPAGSWSEGIVSGKDGAAGYAYLTVLTNPDRVILETKGTQGEIRKKLVIPTFTEVTKSAGLAEEGYTFGNPSWVDINNDGNLDLFVDNHYQSPSVLYRNNGDGTFTAFWNSGGDRHGSGWADFNNDGKLDVFITRGARQGSALGNKQDQLFLNKGHGQFMEIAEAAGVTNSFGRGRSVAWGDYNRDGYLDLLIGNLETPLVLYENNRDGTFLDKTVEVGLGELTYRECAFADYDKDGFPDIFCTGGEPDILLKNNGKGAFVNVSKAAGILPFVSGESIAWGDYDNDEDLDLFISRGYNDQDGSLVWNPFTIFFSDKKSSLNETGLTFQTNANSVNFDLYLGGNHQPTLVSIGRQNRHPNEIPFSVARGSAIGKPTFEPGVNPGFFIWEDGLGNWNIRWGTDGQQRQFYGVITGCCITSVTPVKFRIRPPSLKATLYKNNGDGTFTDVTDQAGVGVSTNNRSAVWGDFDNDGYLDLYVANSGTAAAGNAPNYFFRNNRDGTFTDIAGNRGVAAWVAGRGRGATWGDYDNNGFLDLFITNGEDPFPFQKGPHILYRNEGNNNNWLKIKLIGIISNRQGLGTKVRIKIGRHIQYQEANGGGGGHFLSQGAGPLHFGLGQATMVDRIFIHWPSGLTQTLKNISVNQEITVIEGQ